MAVLGKRSTLTVLRESSPGLYLDGGELGDILLPGRYIPPGTQIGDTVDVFIYLDSQDRLVATTEVPRAMVGELACLLVVSVNRQIGAFLDWGLAKDLLLPFREQEQPVMPGQMVAVQIVIDPQSGRIIATTKLDQVLDRTPPAYLPGQKVDLLIASKTPLGYNVIVENAHRGLLYGSGIATPLEVGKRLPGYVGAAREDGKLDLSLDPTGYQRIAPLTEQILDALHVAGGRLDYDDQTPPEVIREVFGVSKKAFKQATGALFKQRRMVFTHPGIQAVEPPARRR